MCIWLWFTEVQWASLGYLLQEDSPERQIVTELAGLESHCMLNKTYSCCLKTKQNKTKHSITWECKLSIIWSKTKTIAWETAFHIVLRNFSRQVGGEISVIYDFREEEIPAIKYAFRHRLAASHKDVTVNGVSVLFCFVLFFKIWGNARIGLIKSSGNINLKSCFAVFSRAQSASSLLSRLSSFQGALKVSTCSSSWITYHRWQVPICSWHSTYFALWNPS